MMDAFSSVRLIIPNDIIFIVFYFSTGDPHETEVDTILLLTDDHYLVAEYESNLDKIVRFEKVPLSNITEIELGLYQQQTKMFQGALAPNLCLRLNYEVDGFDGYFHMLRSPNIRFFNNVAVVIKTHEEVLGMCFLLTIKDKVYNFWERKMCVRVESSGRPSSFLLCAED